MEGFHVREIGEKPYGFLVVCHKELFRRTEEAEANALAESLSSLTAELTRLREEKELLAIELGWKPFPYTMPGNITLWCPPGEAIYISTARNSPSASELVAALKESCRLKDNGISQIREGYARSNQEVCQTLGKALGYPWLKDDQANSPDADESHGVCVGDHVAESIAEEAAKRIYQLTEENAVLSQQRDEWHSMHMNAAKVNDELIEENAALKKDGERLVATCQKLIDHWHEIKTTGLSLTDCHLADLRRSLSAFLAGKGVCR